MNCEERTYVQCAGCRVKLAPYFKGFRACPVCGHKALTVAVITGYNLPDTMELEHEGRYVSR